TIAFNIPGSGVREIWLSTALPAIATTMTIDGSTQPGYAGTPLIELVGYNIPIAANASGLTLTSANNLVKALSINNFRHNGIEISGTGHSTVTLCEIGTGSSNKAGNGGSGIWISASPNNIVGLGNLLAGNGVDGVTIDQAASVANIVKGNRIGTNPAGLV